MYNIVCAFSFIRQLIRVSESGVILVLIVVLSVVFVALGVQWRGVLGVFGAAAA